mgnify:CR=1 FL=1
MSNIDLTDTINTAFREAEKQARENVQKTIKGRTSDMIHALLQPKGNWGVAEGYLHARLRTMVEDYVTSPEFEAVMQQAIKESADAHAKDALGAVMTHATRGRLFKILEKGLNVQ